MNRDERFNYWYNRLVFYEMVHEKSDVVNIANLAYDEMKICFLNLINDEGINFLKEKLETENNYKLIRKALGFFLPIDKEYATTQYDKMVKQRIETFMFIEPYGSQEMRNNETLLSFKKSYLKLIKKKKIKLENEKLLQLQNDISR